VVRLIVPVVVLAVALALATPSLLRGASAPAPAAPRVERAVAAAAASEAGDMPGRAVINADGGGHYRTQATVDGRLLDVIVDTGASAVVLRYEDAERIGLAGAGSTFDVPALVAPPGALAVNLLGMSALGRLRRIEARQGQLVLEN
jgi:aspartyl protease family protein